MEKADLQKKVVKRYIFLDTETTGLKVSGGDKILEVACVLLEDGKITEECFHHYVNPERKVSGTEIHGITDEMVIGKPKFFEIADSLINFLNKDSAKYENIIVAHNAAFDMKFLKNELNEEQNKILSQIKVLDTLLIARKKFPNEKVNLDALCNKYSIDITQRQKNGHSAILDVKLLRDVFNKIIENFDLKSIEKKTVSFVKRGDVFNFFKKKYGLSKKEELENNKILTEISG